VELQLGGVYYWLERLQGNGKVGRKGHMKKSAVVAAKFKPEVGSGLEAVLVPEDRQGQIEA
jgi:hypothetical protein